MDNSTTVPIDGAITGSGTSRPLDDVVLLICYAIIGLLGTVGNSLVIYVMVRSPSLRSVTNVLICNQAIIDLASSIFFVALYLFPAPPIPESAVAASVYCKLWLSDWPLWGCSVSSTVNLVLLTLERYFAVMHPIKYRFRFSMRRAKLLAVVPWIIGPLHELAWALVQTVNSDGECVPDWPSVTLQSVLGVVFFVGHYMLPVSLMVYVYTKIILKLRRDWRSPTSKSAPSSKPPTKLNEGNSATNDTVSSSTNTGPCQPQLPTARRKFSHLASKSVLRTMFIVSASYVICWGPNETIYLLFNLGVDVQFQGFYHNFSVIFVLLNMCLNPIIYAFHYEELKKALRSLFPCSLRGKIKLRCCKDKSRSYDMQQLSATITSSTQTITPLSYHQTVEENNMFFFSSA